MKISCPLGYYHNGFMAATNSWLPQSYCADNRDDIVFLILYLTIPINQPIYLDIYCRQHRLPSSTTCPHEFLQHESKFKSGECA